MGKGRLRLNATFPNSKSSGLFFFFLAKDQTNKWERGPCRNHSEALSIIELRTLVASEISTQTVLSKVRIYWFVQQKVMRHGALLFYISGRPFRSSQFVGRLPLQETDGP